MGRECSERGGNEDGGRLLVILMMVQIAMAESVSKVSWCREKS